MHNHRTASILTLSLALFNLTARAQLIYQSANPGGYGDDSGSTIGGYVGSGQILGAIFSTEEHFHVEGIGGLFLSSPLNGPDDIFGAIVRLSDPFSLPTGDPFSFGEVLASTVFHVNGATAHDVTTPLSLDLIPGHYAVVFGSGYFGAKGIAAAASSENALNAQYLYWGDAFPGGTSWHEGGHINARFFVLGSSAVPEPDPARFIFGFSSIFGVILYRAKKRRVDKVT